MNITRESVGTKYRYVVDGNVFFEASAVLYTHVSLTRIPNAETASGYSDVIGFSKTRTAATKGRADMRKYAVSVTVIEIEAI